ncbi:hypothetical protein Bca52824_084091 [Brassica carinata]|uniref:Uncharacterized protein n=1 Tax=Brassica carinata TaxID=52824 RepID=A0A8X7PLY8_BRACI|nr:hypothetical protein Bca52824_084091 [Brassica carinata]
MREEEDEVDQDQSLKRGRRNTSPRGGRRSFGSLGSEEKPTRSRAGRRSLGKTGSQEKPRSGRNKVKLTTEKSS